MSGRIETTGCYKEATSKWSKNERLSFTKAGVDIGEDLQASAQTAGKISIITSKLNGVVGTTGVQEEPHE